MKKTFLYFMKWNFPTPGLKALVFLGEPRRAFVTVSSHYFISLLIFIFFFLRFHCWLHLCSLHCFWTLLTAFVYFILCQLLRFCAGVAVLPRVLRIWESAFYTKAFCTLLSFATYSTTCFYQRFPGAGLPLRFETQTLPICLFESHTVQKV